MRHRVWNTTTLLALFIGFALVCAFLGVRLFGLTPYAVISGSMEPAYPVGSLIYVRDASPSDVTVGEAIAFRLPSGTLVAHQVYEIDTDAQVFRTQGIANRSDGGTVLHDAKPVAFDQLVGKPVASVPLLGYVNAFLTSPPGIFMIVVVLGVLIGTSFLFDRPRIARDSAPDVPLRDGEQSRDR